MLSFLRRMGFVLDPLAERGPFKLHLSCKANWPASSLEGLLQGCTLGALFQSQPGLSGSVLSSWYGSALWLLLHTCSVSVAYVTTRAVVHTSCANALLAMASELYVAFELFCSLVQDGPFSRGILAEGPLTGGLSAVMESLE